LYIDRLAPCHELAASYRHHSNGIDSKTLPANIPQFERWLAHNWGAHRVGA
jgi:hypothetical protein